MNARRLRVYSTLLLLVAASPVLAVPGDLDPSFGTGGVVLGPVGSQFYDMVRQADGKLVAAGVRTLTPAHFLVARFEADGTLDATFGTGGMVETAAAPGVPTVGQEVLLQPDGKIVVAGSAFPVGGDVVMALARYETDGTLDATFGTGGIVTLAGPADQYAYALALQSDGKLVAAGGGSNGIPTAHDWRSVLARFETDGTLDATFGTGGVVIRPGSQIDAILQQPDGKLVAHRHEQPGGGGRDFAVARYETDGSLDATFGTGGVVTTDIGNVYDQAYAIVRQADGGFVVGGWTRRPSSGESTLVLARYDAAGALDATFGTGGIAEVPTARHDVPVGLAEQPNGKLVMGAHIVVDDVANLAVVRWQANGTLDTSFGNGGVAATRISSGCCTADLARAVVFEPDGRILAVGAAASRGAVVAHESGFCCTGGPCVECGVCETCGLAGCEAAPVASNCPDDGNVCTTEGCDGAGTCLHPAGPAGVACPDEGNICTRDVCDAAGTCLHPFEPAPACDQPSVAGAASLKMRSSADPGKDRVQLKWAKGHPTLPVDHQTMRLCVYDRSDGGDTRAYDGSPSDPNGVWRARGTTNASIKYVSKTGVPDGITKVVLKLRSPLTKSTAQVQAAGDLALAPFPLQKNPSVVAQIRWASGQCWGATFSTATKNDGERFVAKSD
jgi:uncharacterized delta-60 repeat protein